MVKIKMKGWLYRIYENAEGRLAFMYIHMNKTVRYIIDDTNIPSKTGTLEHVEKELTRLGYHFIEEKPVDFVTERHKRRMRRDAKRAHRQYVREHPEVATELKRKYDEINAVRDHMNDDQTKDEAWNSQWDMIRKNLPKEEPKRSTWIAKYNVAHKYFAFSIETGKTPSGYDYTAYRLQRKN